MANDNQPINMQQRNWLNWLMSLSKEQFERQVALAKLDTGQRHALEQAFNRSKPAPAPEVEVVTNVKDGNNNQLQEAQKMLADIAGQTPYAEAIQVKNRKGQLITVTIVGPRASGKTRVLDVVEALIAKM